MSDWHIERGIGEIRAALIEDETIVEARLDRGGLRYGAIVDAKLVAKRGRRGIAEAEGEILLVEPWPEGTAEGRTVSLEITREAIPERGRIRDAKARQAGAGAGRQNENNSNSARHGGHLSEFGWDELVEEARTGIVEFPGGLLAIVPTPAGTAIDVDGDLAASELATAGAAAAARAIRRLDIGGSVLIDLPSLEGRAARQAAAAALDAHLPQPFERTGVNGFGLLQIVRPRRRASLLERLQNCPVESAALDLLRRAERAGSGGRLSLAAAAAVIAWIEIRPALAEELARRTGAAITLKSDASIPLWSGDVHHSR